MATEPSRHIDKGKITDDIYRVSLFFLEIMEIVSYMLVISIKIFN